MGRAGLTGNVEEIFLAVWRLIGHPNYKIEREYRFHPERRWRFDFAFPRQRLAVEINGRGRHQTWTGYEKDCEKYTAAAQLGWRLCVFTAAGVRRNPQRAVEEVLVALNYRRHKT